MLKIYLLTKISRMKTLKRLLFFIASICLLIACSKSDSFLDNDSFGNNHKSGQIEPLGARKFSSGDVFNLTGKALFDTWKVKDGEVLQDVHNDCWAELEIMDKNNFKITLHERKSPDFVLDVECYGKIAASGVLSFKYPTPIAFGMNITDIIIMNSCATIWGPGVNEGTLFFKGKFDGKKFTDTASFMAKIEEYCPNNYMFKTPVDGNLHWTFGHDLTVVED
jgi:hypothetical protein